MATNVDQAYYGWSHGELSDQDESQDVSISQMLDHGSISFGRFALESLAWEKRSVFTHNQSQEEIEKLKSPGLVAQKKAYFEEYYKRIRAMKGLQENQQTELTLDYGGDGSISSQTGEEEEASTVNVLDKEQNCEAIQVHPIGIGPTSSRESLEMGQKKSTESTLHEPLIESKGIEQHDLSALNDKSVSRKYGSSEPNIEQEKKIISAVLVQHLDRESTMHELPTRGTKEKEQYKPKGDSRKNNNFETVIQPGVAFGDTMFYSTNSEIRDSECKLDSNIVSEKVKPTVKKYKDHSSVSKSKGPVALIRNGLRLEIKTQSGTKTSNGPRRLSQKTISISWAKNSDGSCNTTADRVSRSYTATSVISHKTLTEVRSSVTIPRPFSFSAERRAALPVETKDSAPRSSTKSPKRLASSQIKSKDTIIVQCSSKQHVTYGVKSGGIENKRDPKEMRKIALTSPYSSFKGRGGDFSGPPKARSINLAAHVQFNPNGGGEKRASNVVKKDKQEGKEGASVREVRGTAANTSATQTTNLKPETKKKAAASTIGHLPRNERKARISSSLLDGTKPRQEMPRWR